MLIQYLLDFTYIVLEYTNTVIHTKGKKQCNFHPHSGKPISQFNGNPQIESENSFCIIYTEPFWKKNKGDKVAQTNRNCMKSLFCSSTNSVYKYNAWLNKLVQQLEGV
jgi:hypothetical protein